MDASMAAALEMTALRKVNVRAVPLCILLYILCNVDRIDVSFATLTMNADLDLSPYVQGLAAAFVSTITALGCALWMPRGAASVVGLAPVGQRPSGQ